MPKASKTLLRGHSSAAGTAARCAGAPAGSILSPVLWSPCVGRAGSSSSQEQGAAEMWPPKGWAASRRALAIHGLASLCSGGTRQVRGLRPPRRELGRREPVPPLNSQNTPHGGSATCCACCGCRLASFSATYTRRGRQPRVKVHQRDRGFKSSPTFTAFTITKRQRSSFQLTKIRGTKSRGCYGRQRCRRQALPVAATPGRVWLTVSTPSSWRLHVSYNDPNKRGPSCTAAASGGFVRLPLTQRGALERSRVCQR